MSGKSGVFWLNCSLVLTMHNKTISIISLHYNEITGKPMSLLSVNKRAFRFWPSNWRVTIQWIRRWPQSLHAVLDTWVFESDVDCALSHYCGITTITSLTAHFVLRVRGMWPISSYAVVILLAIIVEAITWESLLVRLSGTCFNVDLEVCRRMSVSVIMSHVLVIVGFTSANSQPFDAHCCHMGAAIKHRVPDRVQPSFVIFNIRALWRLGLSVRVPLPYLRPQSFLVL